MPTRKLGFLLAILGILMGLASSSGAAEKLSPKLLALINSPEYQEAHWGCLVVDLDSGETLYELNADKLFAPASTTKLFSCATALDSLGANYRFETPVYRRGDLDQEGRLKGDLILVASGDLTMGGRTTPEGKIAFVAHDHTYANDSLKGELTAPDPLQGLNELAQKVAASGIKQVRGDVVIDDRLFEIAESSGSGPVRVSPILINDNLLDFVIAPTKSGQLAQMSSRPETASIRVDSRIFTVAAGESMEISVHYTGPRNVRLEGQIPEGHKPLLRTVEISDSVSFARSLLIEALQRAGVVVERSVWADNSKDKLGSREEVTRLPKVATILSPPLHESVKLILKSSHNLHASTLPLLIAAKNGKQTLADGLKIEREFLIRAGVNTETISFGGGAGGSPADAVTPGAAVQLLRHMASRPDAAVYRSSLPILGVDGTLS
ncbi:MAG: dac, partial [Planctomycetaceae bacterium]|nr:dac [Planctomycetaceae bacterium]